MPRADIGNPPILSRGSILFSNTKNHHLRVDSTMIDFLGRILLNIYIEEYALATVAASDFKLDRDTKSTNPLCFTIALIQTQALLFFDHDEPTP
jgi:hypothetical protein